MRHFKVIWTELRWFAVCWLIMLIAFIIPQDAAALELGNAIRRWMEKVYKPAIAARRDRYRREGLL